ncbi:hypothetical protein F2P81_013829 [Scophthalmus maximus]|uniref:Uncharacterized protein n=1 Tax=Scophthalmus maximus TaxID=52904 RepID=A0A6A4SI09_SCOMX|nr:hypothetical protein F2P81_013829 [Scophthalmus maximus]
MRRRADARLSLFPLPVLLLVAAQCGRRHAIGIMKANYKQSGESVITIVGRTDLKLTFIAFSAQLQKLQDSSFTFNRHSRNFSFISSAEVFTVVMDWSSAVHRRCSGETLLRTQALLPRSRFLKKLSTALWRWQRKRRNSAVPLPFPSLRIDTRGTLFPIRCVGNTMGNAVLLCPGFAQLYNSELLQYECCSINCAVPMAALRDEAKERTSQFMSGNGPAGLSSANMETVLGLPGSDGV